MKLLKTIKDRDLPKDFKTREASRAVLFDTEGLIPVLFASRFNYHKLPGGGIKNGEDKVAALTREVKEETGSEIVVEEEVGKITEYRSEFNLYQTSYCYLGKVISKGETSFTRKEKINGFEVLWLPIDKAIDRIGNDKTENYEGKFIKERDLAFLKEAKKLIQNKKCG